MIDGIFSQPEYVAAKKMLDVSALRHEAIASNLANLETPNYKRLDVAPNFEAQLQQAVAGQDVTQMANLQPQLAVDANAISSRSDGNTVQLESEMMKLAQNTLENQVESQMVTSSFLKLKMAISGKA